MLTYSYKVRNELEKMLEEGKLQIEGHRDTLSMDLEFKEHIVYVRGVTYGVTLPIVLGDTHDVCLFKS